jgi:hypothetical protein
MFGLRGPWGRVAHHQLLNGANHMKDHKQPKHDLSTREMVLRFLIAYKGCHDGNTPSTREIADGCTISTSTVRYHLTWLCLEGRLRIRSQRPLQVELSAGTWGLAGQDSQDSTLSSEAASPRPPAPRE